MFLDVALDKKIHLEPRHFGPHMRETLIRQTVAEVEGTYVPKHGYVVAVVGARPTGPGMLTEGTAMVTFDMKCRCVVLRPFKAEILEAVVTRVTKTGFFAEAGPVNIFVSSNLIPEGMSYKSGHIDSFQSEDGTEKIQADSSVRVKIVGMRVEASKIFCVASIKDDFLGLVAEAGMPI